MAGVEGLDFRAHAEIGHLLRHRPQHGGRVGHDVVAEAEVHRAAIERADFRQAFGDMGRRARSRRPCRCPCAIQRQRAFDIAENQVAAHAGRQVQHDIDVGGADAVGDFLVEVVAAARGTGFGIADMAVDDGGPGLGGVDRGICDLLGSDGNVAGFRNGIAGTGDGAGDEDIAVHRKRHFVLLVVEAITGQDGVIMLCINRKQLIH